MLDGPDIFVGTETRSIFGLPNMEYGNKPTDGGYLILSPNERNDLLQDHPESAPYIFRYMGSEETIKGKDRYCIWVTDDQSEEASRIKALKARFDAVAAFRAASTAAQTRPSAAYPHRFRQAQNWARKHQIIIPIHTSENRDYLPVDRQGADVIASNACLVLYDSPDWCFPLICSRLHLVWIGTVCGKLKSDFRYSNTLGWNTFPVPKFTDDQLAALKKSAMAILRCRLTHHPKTIADLYDPETMPDDLRAVHKANDDLLESMYVGRPFRNDTERLEHLFKLYAARVKKLKKGAA